MDDEFILPQEPDSEPGSEDEKIFNAVDVYTRHLSSAQNGYAMWFAFTREVAEAPAEIDVQVGDVGFFHAGDFYRYFNIFNNSTHPSNSKGVPEAFVALPLNEQKDLKITKDYFSAGHVLCGGQLRSTGAGNSASETDPDTLTYTFQASGPGAALVVLDNAHKTTVQPTRLSALQKYFDSHVEAWGAFISKESGYDVPAKNVNLIYGFTKTGSSLHVVASPQPDVKTKPTLEITVDTTDGIHPTVKESAGWNVECVGGPYMKRNPDLFSRYVFVDRMSKSGVIGGAFRAAMDALMTRGQDPWDMPSSEA